jgi:protein-L-isoaspartate(D-aspartate) O-methyltransferase
LKPFLSIFDLDFSQRRRQMVDTQLLQRGIRDERVLTAMARVPRHEFVADPYRAQAYDDNPLPIGEGQTISQPYIVALMLEMLEVSEEDIVLEIGTGSGYQTALLAQLSRHVYSIERHAALAAKAQAALAKLGYTNVTIEVGDGSKGLSAHAPFDGIVVSAAAPDLPQALFEQLKEGGRLVVPVGPTEAQFLQLVTKKEGKPVLSEQIPCRFVPLIGEQGYRA